MPSLSARTLRPVVVGLGKALAAAPSATRVRQVYGAAALTFAPSFGTPTETVERAGLPTLRVQPGKDARPAGTWLWFHGGGYVFGTLQGYAGMAGRLASASGLRVEVPDYRLAPEHPHPAQIEDGMAVYRELLAEVGAERLVVGGDSAGGHLSVAVLQRAREEGLDLPAALVLASPWLDLRPSLTQMQEGARGEILILPRLIDRCRDWFADGADLGSPAISPLLGDLAGLPPTMVTWTTNEMLRDDAVAFVDRARAAGVAVTERPENGLWHDWPLLAPLLSEGRRTIAELGAFAHDALA